MSSWIASLWGGGAGGGASAAAPSASPTPVASAPAAISAPAPGSPAAGAARPQEGATTSDVLQSLMLELVSMSASYALLFLGMRYFMKEMDPMKKQKQAARASKRRLIEKLAANGRKPFTMNDYEMIISSDLIYPEDIDADFSMIGGLEHVKQEVFDIVALPLRRPDLFQGRSGLLCPPKGILLYGPPGTGKTMMAKAIAKESGAAFINLQMSTTMNKWFGESQKLVRATFSLAWKLAPCVIFIDEIDSFLRERTSDDHAAQGNMKAEFMALWDGLLSADIQRDGRAYGVIVVGATNRPWDVDQAILRRMPRTFKLSLPDAAQRLDILRIFLGGETLDAALAQSLPALAASLEGYSGSDLKELCQAAAMRPFREFAAACRTTHDFEAQSELRPLALSDFEAARQDVRATGEAAYAYHGEASSAPRGASNPVVDTDKLLAAMMQSLAAAQRASAANGTNGHGPSGSQDDDID